MLSTEEARNTINFNDFCWPDAFTARWRTVSDIPGDLGRPLMTGTVVRPCCAKLPAQVLLSECLLVPVPAVTALALKDNSYSKRSTIISESRGRWFRIGFHCLTPWYGMEVPTDCEFIPKD